MARRGKKARGKPSKSRKSKRSTKTTEKPETKKPASKKTPKPKPSQPRQRDYKAEYARRVAKGLKSGKTRQQARGHKPQEHIERRKTAGLTEDQQARIEDFYNNEYNPTGRDKDRVSLEDVLEWATEHGMKQFNVYARGWRKLENAWNNAGRPYRPGIYSEDDLRGLAEGYNVPDLPWLYYH